MGNVRNIFVRHHLVWSFALSLLSGAAYLVVVNYIATDWSGPGVIGLLVIWTGIGYMETSGTVEYWVRAEFLQKVIDALLAEGFVMRKTNEGSTLYVKKLKYARRRFAILSDHTAHFTLEISERCEKMMDQHITTEMLCGGKRLVGRRLFRKKPKVQEVNG
jgi:hypothetical protein